MCGTGSDAAPKQGQIAEAEALCRRAVENEEKSLGANHPSVAKSLGFLASVSWKLGRAEEPEALRRRQLSINRDALGPDHDATASSYSNLGWVQLTRGKWQKRYQTTHRHPMAIASSRWSS
jgi:hypothetical protein